MNLLLAIIARLPLYYLYVTLALGAMALLRLPFASFLFRLFAAYATLCGCALYGVAASIALRLVGRHRSSQWATGRAFKWSMRVTCGLRFNILAGAEHLEGRPVVLVGNHQTALDVLMLGTVFPRHCSVTAKTSLRHAPFLGWFMALSGTVFIDRGNRQSAVKAFAGAAAEMRDQRQSVFIFPEGTRSGTQRPMMLPFKKGAFHLAIQAKVPIVPVITAVYSGVLCPKQMRFRRGVIPVIGASGSSFVQSEHWLKYAVQCCLRFPRPISTHRRSTS